MSSSGYIRADELYSLDEAKSRMGWSVHAMRSARRAGLAVRYFAGRGYVTGAALIEFIAAKGKESK